MSGGPPPPPPSGTAPKKSWKTEVEVKRSWRDTYPLHCAACEGNSDAIQEQLNKSDGEVCGVGQLTQVDDDGWSPLHYSSWYDKRDVVRLLLDAAQTFNEEERGQLLNLKVKDSGATPLHFASGVGRAEVVALLLKHGADPSIMNNEKQTPLMLAQDLKQNDWEEVVKLLQA
eukprot:TRINITY_DN13461_c0_g1_i1.p1 TRINITY_DN13461_c0_g1~~TRINITY_DN13461_c0_g1_i1.p1  ORF type:complete len:201 (+),score=21.93 TRINITY_DN13461_c0_g1_i1:90-605(+)